MSKYLLTKIEFLKGVGPIKASLLNKELSIYNYGELIKHFPFRYEDRSIVLKVNEITKDLPHIQVKGIVKTLRHEGTGKGKRLICILVDSESSMELIWFNGINYINKYLEIGK